MLAFASSARRLLTAATVALVAATAGAATAGAQHARARTPVPIDSLGPLIRADVKKHADGRPKNDDITLLRVQVARGVAGVLVVCR